MCMRRWWHRREGGEGVRILCVLPYYAPEGGGLERYAHAMLQRLASWGHVTHALAFTRGRPGIGLQDGVVVHRVPALFFAGNTPIDTAFARRVRDAVASYRPDVVWAHTPVPFAAEMAYLAARSAGVPFVVTYHAGRLTGSTPLLRVLGGLDRWTLQRRMLRGATRVMAVGPFVRDHALARVRDKVTVVPPGVDAAWFRPGPAAGSGNILFVGPLSRHYRWKGLDTLLDAYRLVRRRVPGARLTLVGEGERVESLQRLAGGEGLDVRFAGRLDEVGLVRAYREASVAVLPSISDAESFGMVLAEANSCGRPVVASRIGGIPDFVRDGHNGLLAQPGDARDLADKITRVLADPGLARRLGTRGRWRVVREHDWDDLARRCERVLVEAVLSGS